MVNCRFSLFFFQTSGNIVRPETTTADPAAAATALMMPFPYPGQGDQRCHQYCIGV